MAPVLFGFVALGVDTTMWQITLANMQGATELAAWSAGLEYKASGKYANGQAWGKAIAGQNGFVNGVNNVTVTVNIPPTSGTHTGTSGAVEVVITQPQTLYVSKVLPSSWFGGTIGARAVVGSTGGYNTCMAALDSGSTGSSLAISGSGNTVNLSNCAYASNNTSASSAYVTGTNDSFTAATATLAGNDLVTQNSSDSFCTSPAACTPLSVNSVTSGSHANDPFYGTTVPSTGSPCSLTATSFTSGCTFSATKLASNTTLSFSNGTYIFNGASLTMSNATLNVTNATLVFIASSSATGNLAISGTSTVNLTAPTSGTYSGLAIWGIGIAGATTPNYMSVGGTVTMTQSGAIYLPNSQMTLTGGGSGSSGGITGTCTQIFASKITITGTGSNLSYGTSCGSALGAISGSGGGTSNSIGILE